MRRLYQNFKSIGSKLLANIEAQSSKFCVHHILRTALASIKIFLLLSPEGHGVSKCKFTCHSAGIEPVVNARVRIHDQKSMTLTIQLAI
ncbi:hypothetical protein O3M35_010206 [Rhynocoris fuscipes]|uniref:Uncharacterized protein n=1 Tax=Rhynocoris fuscipes TaxID=488301 RepID=A0AAW1CZ21_9HEMI